MVIARIDLLSHAEFCECNIFTLLLHKKEGYFAIKKKMNTMETTSGLPPNHILKTP